MPVPGPIRRIPRIGRIVGPTLALALASVMPGATIPVARAQGGAENPFPALRRPPQPGGENEGADPPRTQTAAPQAPPSAEDAAREEKRIRENFAQDVAAAALPQNREAVVRKFLNFSSRDAVSPAQKYAFLNLAATLAEGGGDVGLVGEVLTSFGRAFSDIDAEARLLAYLAVREKQAQEILDGDVDWAVRVNRRLRDASRFAEAEAAIGLADKMLARAPAAVVRQWRDAVSEANRATSDESALDAAATTARKTLEVAPDDPAANAAVGSFLAARGDWEQAIAHLRRCDRRTLREAAELGPGPDAVSDELCRAGEAWWEAADAEDTATLPRAVHDACRWRAAEFYQRALDLGIANPLIDQEARIRVAEGFKKQPPKPKPVPRRGNFDADAFARCDRERRERFHAMQDALRGMKPAEFNRDKAALQANRPHWLELLQPGRQDDAVPAKLAAVQQALQQGRPFVDGYVYESFLHMQNGDEDAAKVSVDAAWMLVDGRPFAEQIYRAEQLLDLAHAAILAGRIDIAKKIDAKFLDKNFPNHWAVKFVQSLIKLHGNRFADAIRDLEDACKNKGLEGQAKGWVAGHLAWLRAAVPENTKLRAPQAAEDYADQALKILGGECWLAHRAKAELRASEGNFPKALESVDQAETQAPQIFGKELNRQRTCYLEGRGYEIERRKP